MAFSDHERQRLLALNGVGETVIARLEQAGYNSLNQLVGADPARICAQVAGMLRASCWGNSPQARAAISAIVGLAQSSTLSPSHPP
ncbi:helix-hairpin-helix domain-containing protein [Lysobacter enzymogenes]|uniref:helix-hairpin-helix domain-containing protein n=1 Tax=Lysobacter enzymogenes TaxID=69 RepID=UPI001A9569DE|nr:helix-hairpin-helix domain-containing protein [Lysobacter enzymogenes]QQP96191.1 helix-hairpin-helix domain-containing protein [Lysobacter enzymogenes]